MSHRLPKHTTLAIFFFAVLLQSIISASAFSQTTDTTPQFDTSCSQEILSQHQNNLSDPETMLSMDIVVLQGLDKITTHTSTFEVAINETVKFGSLYIQPRACRKNPPIEKPESAAFLQIWEQKNRTPQWVFSNWMFASSPALSALDHAVYDVWVLDCKKAETNSDSDEKLPDSE